MSGRPSDQRPTRETEDIDEDVRVLLGEEAPEDQDGAIEIAEVEPRRTPTLTELDRGETGPADEVVDAGNGAVVSLDALVSGELGDDETDDPDVATEEGLSWVPPSDPPLIADPEEEDGIVVAAGIGASALDEPYDDDHRSEGLTDEGDVNARIREAIRADAATSRYADRILIAVLGSTVILRGAVDDILDSDDLVAVVERVSGVREVRDETDVADLG
jgi:hypothetical protein